MQSSVPLPPKTRGPSIADVARLAGVSAQTVSRVSTGADNVRLETRERVQEAMKQLGYAPNKAARALRSGSFRSIGVVTQRLERTGEAFTPAGVFEAANKMGYTVTLLQIGGSDDDELQRAGSRLNNLSIDGLVIVRIGHAAYDSLSLPASLPVAVSDSRFIGHYSSVAADQVRGTHEVVDYLLGLGHQTVHHITGNRDSQPALLREVSWRRTLTQRGALVPQVYYGDWSARSGYEAGGRLLDSGEPVTAVYCANDETAFGLMRAARERGIRIPQDLSVVGFDDIAVSEFAEPPLTTIRQDFKRMGEELMALLAKQIDARTLNPIEEVLVPAELIIRDSTGPAPSK